MASEIEKVVLLTMVLRPQKERIPAVATLTFNGNIPINISRLPTVLFDKAYKVRSPMLLRYKTVYYQPAMLINIQA